MSGEPVATLGRGLDQYIPHIPKRPDSPSKLEPEVERDLAAHLFNYTWTLLEKERRAEEDELMIHAAHAARLLWWTIAKPEQHARGEWQLARVYSVLGRAEPALHHARRSLEICEQNGIRDFDLAFAYEALARAHAVAGDREESARFLELGRQAAEQITEDDDREIVLRDLASVRL